MRTSIFLAGVCMIALVSVRAFADEKEAPKKKSLKGWELYAHLDGEKKEWKFGLLLGTNRVKTAKEISDSITLDSKGLEKELSGLAEGEMVFLQTRVPDKVRKEIEDHCTKAKLTFRDITR
jgi:hypothetical protein